MEWLNSITSNLSWILGAVFLFAAVLGSIKYAANRYKRVSPSKVGIVYGRKHSRMVPQPDGTSKEEQLGFQLITGGGKLILPIVEEYADLDLRARGIQVEVKKIANKDGVKVSVEGIASVSIGAEESPLIAAARKFQGMTDPEINDLIKQILEGQLRAILGTLSIEDLVRNREELNAAVLKGSEQELLKLGVKIDILAIQNISDEEGYIDAMGVGRTAEVKRDAAIKKAEADRDAAIAESNAKRQAETVAAENEVKIADAKKIRDVQVAQFKVQTETEQAKADLAGALATAEMEKKVRQAQVAAESAETESRIELAQKEAQRMEQELVSTVLKPAEASREQTIINAEAKKRQQIIEAEALYEAATKNAEAIKTKAEADAQAARKLGEGNAAAKLAGLVAEADGKKAALLADAEGRKANLLAEAEGKQAELLAEAKGAEAKLLAEAKGKEQLALALAKLDQTGKLLQILDAAPRVAEALGDALAKALGPEGLANVFGQAAAPLGSVDSIRLYDFGGNGKDGYNPISKIANVAPDLVFGVLAKMKALGMGAILEKFGITSDLLNEAVEAASKPPSEKTQ